MNVLMLFATQMTKKSGFDSNRMNPIDRMNLSLREASYWFRSNHLFFNDRKNFWISYIFKYLVIIVIYLHLT